MSTKRWLELSTNVISEDVEAVAEVFHRFGYGGVVIEEAITPSPDGEGYAIHLDEPVIVRVYLPLDREAAKRKRRIEESLGYLSLIHPMPPLRERQVAEEDWANAWKAHFQVHRIGHLVIKPTWQDYLAHNDEVVIELDPGMAFGTGLHPTTRMCLLELQRRLQSGMTVLDMGTGSGILAIAAAKLGASSVLALDIDSVAVEAAQDNVAANGVGDIVTIQHGTLPLGFEKAKKLFDLILANITARVLSERAENLIGSLKQDGLLIASGIIAEKLDAVIARFLEAKANIAEVIAEDDWRTIIAKSAY